MRGYQSKEMVRSGLFTLVFLFLFSCNGKEDSVKRELIFGLYKQRDSKSSAEYICLKDDSSYVHFVIQAGKKNILSEDKWHFELNEYESRIGLDNFEKMGVSCPILFSHFKNAVVIRIDGEDTQYDFVKISESCSDN